MPVEMSPRSKQDDSCAEAACLETPESPIFVKLGGNSSYNEVLCNYTGLTSALSSFT
jgi:hypothetical protein